VRLHRDAKAALLRRVPLFAGCTKAQLGQVARIADELDLPAGRTLTKEGAPGREFFALAEGRAEVTKKGRKVATLSDGDFFGEIALLTNMPRNATVTSTTPVRLLVVTDRDFQRLLLEQPRLQRSVLQALTARLAVEPV
jgi:CRP-like cAMP-binding protein